MTNQLANIKNFDQLIRYLEDELDWPCQEYGFDEITFKYTPEELGIKDEDSVQIKQIHQLRPFYQGQPWGIFFIEFEKKRLPVALLRRVLSHLVVKKRASANSADKAVWNMDNLLFISAFGDASTETREIAFAHFHQEDGDLPTLKVLGWDGADTVLKMEFVDQELHEKLHWPKDPKNVEAWQSTWSSAFRHKPGFVIKTANALADRLAELARGIRGAAETLMAHESEKGPLRQLYKAFQTALIHDLTEADFADTYAQTITYGLLTAAISRTDMSGGIYGTALVASNVTDLVPITNPFLKEMLETFIHAGDHKGGIQFDELGIQDVVDLLRGEETDLPAVLRDFDNKTPGEDPVIQFYEHFLSAYNKKLKIQRGVFYTPKPVVSYIVRSVDELLKTEFGLEDGLADTTTWGEMEKKIPRIKRPESTDPDSPFVMILDPATGTATFLVEVIDVIFKTLTDKWENQHLNKSAQMEAWNEYVPKHLLPRLFGYELMMAPYAIAHMKIGLKLFETGYRFGSTERVRIFLTNSLEPASDLKLQQSFAEMSPALAHEAKAVNEVKNNINYTVVIGNPPYSNYGMMNKGVWILDLLNDYKNGLKEKKINLDDDYIKFIRYGQWHIGQTGTGILGFITNNTYLDGITHRRMRDYLLENFQKIFLLDLHGSSTRKELSPVGEPDKNVFDIKQGVSIGIFVRNNSTSKHQIYHTDLRGSRKTKYNYLSTNNLIADSINNRFDNVNSISPNFFFVPKDFNEFEKEYFSFISLKNIFITSGLPVKTERDKITIHFDIDSLEQTVKDFQNLEVQILRKKYDLQKDSRDWKIAYAKADVQAHLGKQYFKKILYRPFDFRYIWYSGKTRGFVGTPGYAINQNMDKPNLAMITSRTVYGSDPWRDIFVSNLITEFGIMATRPGNSAPFFPLYIYSDKKSEQISLLTELEKQSNFSREFLLKLNFYLHLNILNFGKGDLQSSIGPEDIFYYIYAIFSSSTYRTRYVEFLKIDFPRLPLTSNLELFQILCNLGSQLVALHLFESPVLNTHITQFIGNKDNSIQSGYPKYEINKIKINSIQAFEGVPQDVWNFHIGGYQVCHKWLKDRRGRQLSEEDITHYQKIIVALKETIRIMGEIDHVIEDHGGWPIK